MVEPDVASSTSASSSKYEYILNWITDDTTENAPIWIEREPEYIAEGYCHSNADTVEQSDSGIDIDPHQQLTRWFKFKM